MPAKKSTIPHFDESKFLSYSLTKEQQAELKKTTMSADDYDNMLLRLEEDGYKITGRYDDFNKAFACWIMPVEKKHPNYGYILTGRGSTPLKAIKQAAYIHYTIFDQDWPAHYEGKRTEEIDD